MSICPQEFKVFGTDRVASQNGACHDVPCHHDIGIDGMPLACIKFLNYSKNFLYLLHHKSWLVLVEFMKNSEKV